MILIHAELGHAVGVSLHKHYYNSQHDSNATNPLFFKRTSLKLRFRVIILSTDIFSIQ